MALRFGLPPATAALSPWRLPAPIARRLDRLRARAAIATTYGARVAIFVGIAFGGGLGSAAYMTSQPTRLTAERNGSWTAWTSQGRPDADPYTRVRFSRVGNFPLNFAAVATYEATTDSEGRRLQSACEYVIEGAEPPASWWSLAVYDDSGRLIPNPADRHAFNSANIARSLDGRLRIVLARDARPGNWLPTGAGGRLTLVLVTVGSSNDAAIDEPTGGGRRPNLPVIKRGPCA